MSILPTKPDLSIVIVSWNVSDLLQDCLRSIDENKGDLTIETIVVDSASSDNTVEMVRQQFPHVLLLAQTENVGFPKGNNIGFAIAHADAVMSLNPDTVIIGSALQTMVAYLNNSDNIGMIGPQLRNTDGSHQSSARRFPSVKTAFFESTWLQKFAPSSLLDSFYTNDLPNDQINEVDWVSGACMLVPRTVLETVGGMDIGYFMYSEEVDWCKRIKEKGLRVVYLPTAKITHHIGASSDQAVPLRHIRFQRAKLRYIRKHHGFFPYLFLRIFLLLEYLIQIDIEAMKWIMGHKRPLRKQRIKAYLQVVASGLPAAGYKLL